MLEISDLIAELEENKNYLAESEQKYVESVCEFYYKNGFVTADQEKWLRIYYSKIVNQLDII